MYTISEGILYKTDDFHRFDQVEFIPNLNSIGELNPKLIIIDTTDSALDYIQQAMFYQNPKSRKSSHLIIGREKDEVVQCTNGSLVAPTFSDYATWCHVDEIYYNSFNIQICNGGELLKTSDGYTTKLGIPIDPWHVFEYDGKFYESITLHQIETLTEILSQLVKDLNIFDVVPLHDISTRKYNPILHGELMDAIHPSPWCNSIREKNYFIKDDTVVYRKHNQDFIIDPDGPLLVHADDPVVAIEKEGLFWKCYDVNRKITYWMPNNALKSGSRIK
jgi:N-acetyl-anhydromuramyl-L-alanine amidase AmpD